MAQAYVGFHPDASPVFGPSLVRFPTRYGKVPVRALPHPPRYLSTDGNLRDILSGLPIRIF